jgi:hypothetical protein
MSRHGVKSSILSAWLSARSIARGLPAPVPEYGGFRVDTGSDAEVVRWVFPNQGPGLRNLARSINEPGYLLKLCGSADELWSALPLGWELHSPSHFMTAIGKPPARRLAEGYSIELDRVGKVVSARILAESGELAASGFAAETQGVFVYDRILTETAHRRKGLGQVLMRTLHDARQNPDGMELLVATQDGRALYSKLGWETISPYSTASFAKR